MHSFLNLCDELIRIESMVTVLGVSDILIRFLVFS